MVTTANSQIEANERAAIFHEQYGNDGDAGITLAELVMAAGNFLTRIVGKEDVDAGMAQIIKRVVEVSGGALGDPSNWREALEQANSSCFSEWVLGAPLHNLAAYAQYGIVLDGSDDPDERQQNLGEVIARAEEFLRSTPTTQWGILPNSDLHRLVRVAGTRWALDNGKPVEPAALAEFGGVSEGHIRNMISSQKRTFTSIDGRIPAQEALAWLSSRVDFWNSIWREQVLPQYGVKHRAALQRAIFIPVARDGSAFHPGLRRGAGYTIGEKGAETQIDDFDNALTGLQQMPVPYWRRPNTAGNWGIVSGVRWARIDASDLEILAKNPDHRIPDDGRA